MATESFQCRYCNYLPDGEYICDPTGPNVCAPCKKLSEIEEKVKSIRLMLVGLENERIKLKTQANQHHDRLIHRLPPEISSNIFELCVPQNLVELGTEFVPERYKSSAAFVISAVSRTWRDIAFSTPRLWKAIPLCSRSLPEPSILKKWIDHAGQLLLSILIRIQPGLPGHGKGDVLKLINVLKQYSTRWLEFDYSYVSSETNWTLFYDLSPNNPHDLPLLRTLRLNLHNSQAPSFRTWFSVYPQHLNALSLCGIPFPPPEFDWTHLSELTISKFTLDEFFEALRRAPNLTKGNFQNFDALRTNNMFVFPTPPNPFVHRSLQGLNLPPDLCRTGLNQLLCPSLKVLTVSTFWSETADAPLINAIVEFLRKSECSLERMSFIGLKLDESDVTPLRKIIPIVSMEDRTPLLVYHRRIFHGLVLS